MIVAEESPTSDKTVFTDDKDALQEYARELAKDTGADKVYVFKRRFVADFGFRWTDEDEKKKKTNGLTSVSRKSAPDAPCRNRKKWTESEQATIINCVNAKTDPVDIAKELNRTEKSVRCRISILRSAGRIH